MNSSIASLLSKSLFSKNSHYSMKFFTARYHKKVIEHLENPKNVGVMDEDDDDVGVSYVGHPGCGDVLNLSVRVKDNVVVDACFTTYGCGSAIAASDVATEWIKGKTVAESEKISNKDIADELSLPPVKLHCSLLAEDAIKDALDDWKKKQQKLKEMAK